MTSIETNHPAAAGSAAATDSPEPTAAAVRGRLAGLFTPSGLVLSILVLMGIVWVFHRWFSVQHFQSSNNVEDWGHSYVIPLISGFLVWRRRQELLASRFTVFWPAVAPFMLGIVCYVFFLVGLPNHMLQGASLLLTIGSAALLLTGPEAFRWLFLPIAFLAFGITISEKIMLEVTFPLQLLAAQGSYIVLAAIGAVGGWIGLGGFAVDVQGNVLTMLPPGRPEIPLNVAEACSGMRMVIAFIALGGAVALIGCKHWWQRGMLMLLAAPVALIMNVVRVAVLGLASLVDPELAAGDAHTIIGTLLLFPSLLLFMGLVWSLQKIVEGGDTEAETAKTGATA